MKDRLSIREMFALIGVDVDCDTAFPVHVASDSRDVQPGGAFVALEGERTDGHRYVNDAIAKGAALIIGRKEKAPCDLPVPYIGLSSPESDLGILAARYVGFVVPNEIIAVTGSVGKTTTREAVGCVLKNRYRLHAAERSFNTVVGCSTTILGMPLNTQILLLEFGANHIGEIRGLTQLFLPTIVLITQIAPVHLAGFGSLSGVLAAKMEITESTKLKSFFYNSDNPLLADAASKLSPSVHRYGVGFGHGDYRICNTQFQVKENSPRLSFLLENGENTTEYAAEVWGTKLALSLAMAAAVGDYLGISLEASAKALTSFSGLKGRGRVLSIPESKGKQRFLIDDAYNANPASMRSSLETYLSLRVDGFRYAVLGDMKELGDEEVRYHEELLDLLTLLDGVIFVGTIWKDALKGVSSDLHKKWYFVKNAKEAAALLDESSDWTALLVKGSNSHQLGELVVQHLVKEA